MFEEQTEIFEEFHKDVLISREIVLKERDIALKKHKDILVFEKELNVYELFLGELRTYADNDEMTDEMIKDLYIRLNKHEYKENMSMTYRILLLRFENRFSLTLGEAKND